VEREREKGNKGYSYKPKRKIELIDFKLCGKYGDGIS